MGIALADHGLGFAQVFVVAQQRFFQLVEIALGEPRQMVFDDGQRHAPRHQRDAGQALAALQALDPPWHLPPLEWPEALRQGGFSVLVAGGRYGKGSSREHSPAAERLAGIRLVIAASFERIYRQNADNIGLFTSTDFGLLDRIEHGEQITLADLVQGREDLAASILSAGGLLRWGQQHLGTAVPQATQAQVAPQTLFEKILSRHLLQTPFTPTLPQAGDGLFVQADWRFIHEYYTGMADTLLRGALGEDFTLQRPEQIVVFEDHTSYVEESPAHVRGSLVANMHAMSRAQRDFAARHGLRMHRTLTDAGAKTDEALVAQLKRSREIFEALNIPMYSKEGFEADDMIGTLSKLIPEESKNNEVMIASGDMDTLQLVDDNHVQVYTLKKGINDTILYNEEKVKERFGFEPIYLPDYKGLRGDPSDNIIGIKGIGEKTATILISKYGEIEKMYKDIKKKPEIFKELGITQRVFDLLKEGEDEAIFSTPSSTQEKK